MEQNREPAVHAYISAAWQAAKLYERMFADLIREYDLTPNEKDVLLFLYHNRSSSLDTARDIVVFRSISKSLVSKSVDHLLQRGYLDEFVDPCDRRRRHLRLSSEAKELVAKLQEAQRKFLNTLNEGFTKEENEELIYLLGKIRENINRQSETTQTTE